MNLHDPNRPRVFYNPAFVSGHHVIPRLQIWPKSADNDQIELSLMLPVPDTRFHGSWKTITVPLDDLPALVQEFRDNPEEFVNQHFGLDVVNLKTQKPEIRQTQEPKTEPKTEPKARPRFSISEILSRAGKES